MILDSDIAKIYGVETKRVNESVQRNLDKFPQGYIFEISKKELENLQCNISTANTSNLRTKNSSAKLSLSKTRVLPLTLINLLPSLSILLLAAVKGKTLVLDNDNFADEFFVRKFEVFAVEILHCKFSNSFLDISKYSLEEIYLNFFAPTHLLFSFQHHKF